jgi:hypothetical protein
MKKTALCLMIMILSFSLLPSTVMATEKEPIRNHTNTNEVPIEVKVMVDRLNEIKEMDKSSLTRTERKELRKEVRSIKKEIKSSGSGLYISTGAVIIILLLIIIL